MSANNNFHTESYNLHQIQKRVPDKDFAYKIYDYAETSELKDIVFILSTPRSGSTFFCDLLYQNNICLPHEYFQTDDYLPILASQWDCIDNGKVNKSKYIQNLILKRTSPNGVLGINLHGEHIKTLMSFFDFIPKVNFHFIHMMRQDTISQAISYEIAIQTGKWSSYFDTSAEPVYSFDGILNKLERINFQNQLIRTFLVHSNFSFHTLYYEQLVTDPAKIIASALPSLITDAIKPSTILSKQSSKVNSEWLRLFSKQYFEHDISLPPAIEMRTSINPFKAFLGRFKTR